ncbi:MAG: hypothetical protein L6R35_006734 [Caloplaca aegaea]|nr:MAG: hypothetical protein L6R35_006734 [Caloplaca aegaea]
MADSTKSSNSETAIHFLSLPLEMRHLVYDQLLISPLSQPCLLYHDRTGRTNPLHLHPHILRANKQINSEATSKLYQGNAFKIDLSTRVIKQCSGGMYPRRDKVPPGLIHKAPGEPLQPYSRSPGLVYPHCLRRLADLEIIISSGSIWGSAWGGSFFSHIGSLVLELLRLLAEDAAEDAAEPRSLAKKRLTLRVEKRLDESFIFGLRQEMCASRKELEIVEPLLQERAIPLLKALEERRDVRIREIKRPKLEDGSRICDERWVSIDELGQI